MRAFLACFLALAACSSDTSPMPGPGGGDDTGSDMGSDVPPPTTDPTMRQDYDDVASIIASNMNVAEFAAMQGAVNISYGRVPVGMTEDVAGGIASGTGSVSGSLAGLAYSLAFECHDVNHVAIPCNGAEDHVRFVVKYTGGAAAANMSMDGVNEKGVFYVRYVNVPKPMYGGTGTTSFTSTLMTGVYTISYTEASAHLQFDPTAPALPSGGTDDFTLTIHRTRDGAADRDFNVSAHLEVTGDDTATLTLDGSEVYNVTLSTGVATHQ